MNAVLAGEIEARIAEMVTRHCPGARGRGMYGGTMYERDPGDFKTGVCGVFVYTHHVSLEFGRGVDLVDTAGVLEGKGKARRHIKLKTLDDLAGKAVEDYVKQAIDLQP